MSNLKRVLDVAPTSLHRSNARPLRILACALVLASLTACAAAKPTGPAAPARPLSTWHDGEASMLDDSLDLGAIRIEEGASGDVSDEAVAKLDARTSYAEGVLKVKVIAATSETVGEINRYRLEFEAIGAPLNGAPFPPPISLVVSSHAPIYATLKAAEARLPGQIVVLFYRRYLGPDEGAAPVVHFHITAASPRVIKEIQDGDQRREVRG